MKLLVMKYLKKYNEVVSNEMLSIDNYAEKIEQILTHIKNDIEYFFITPMTEDWVVHKGIRISIGKSDIDAFDIDDYFEELKNMIEYMIDEDFEVDITSSFHYTLISTSNNLEKVIKESNGKSNLYIFDFTRINERTNEGLQTHQNHLRRIMNQRMDEERMRKRIRVAMSKYTNMIENLTMDIRSDIKDFKIVAASKSWIKVIVGKVNGDILDIKSYYDELKNMTEYMIDEDFIVEIKSIRDYTTIYEGNKFDDMIKKIEKGNLYLFDFYKEKTK